MLDFTITSGGQTGADISALDFARSHRIPHGGWCPKGRKQAKGGVIPSKFPMKETRSSPFAVRTRWNCGDSEGTVIFSTDPRLQGGTKQTALYAKKFGKPPLVLVRNKGAVPPELRLLDFLRRHRIRRLN